LTTDYEFKGDNTKLACSYPALATSVKPGQQILVADGSLVLSVISCHPDKGEVECRVENNAAIGERKNMNLPGVVVELPTFTEKDCDDIVNFGIKNKVCVYLYMYVYMCSDSLFPPSIFIIFNANAINKQCMLTNNENVFIHS
jgi:pyruvate kinase